MSDLTLTRCHCCCCLYQEQSPANFKRQASLHPLLNMMGSTLVSWSWGKAQTFLDYGQCDQIGWFIGLRATFLKPLATINLAKSPTFLGNFCKSVKIYHFSGDIIFGQLYRHLVIFSGHTDCGEHQPRRLSPACSFGSPLCPCAYGARQCGQIWQNFAN